MRDADQIVVLDEGHVVERGSHDELIERGGAYAALVARDVTDEPDLPDPGKAAGPTAS